MEVVRPWAFEQEQCRRAVVDSIVRIRELDLVPPGALRTKLRKVAKALGSVRVALEQLPEWERRELLTVEQVKSAEKESTRRAEEVIVRASGGAKADAARMQVAAACAFKLLFMRQLPTLTKDGVWIRLANLLFELATDKRGRDASRACQKHMERLRQLGEWPTKEDMRRLRRDARLNPIPNELVEAVEADRWTDQTTNRTTA